MSRLKPSLHAVLLALCAAATCNLNAVVDLFLHREIPYFDVEHMIVGGTTGLAFTRLYWALILHMRYLDKAEGRLLALESILPICSHCKKIRKPNSDPDLKESWSSIESYFRKRTKSEFSHSVCPDCVAQHYSKD